MILHVWYLYSFSIFENVTSEGVKYGISVCMICRVGLNSRNNGDMVGLTRLRDTHGRSSTLTSSYTTSLPPRSGCQLFPRILALLKTEAKSVIITKVVPTNRQLKLY